MSQETRLSMLHVPLMWHQWGIAGNCAAELSHFFARNPARASDPQVMLCEILCTIARLDDVNERPATWLVAKFTLRDCQCFGKRCCPDKYSSTCAPAFGTTCMLYGVYHRRAPEGRGSAESPFANGLAAGSGVVAGARGGVDLP